MPFTVPDPWGDPVPADDGEFSTKEDAYAYIDKRRRELKERGTRLSEQIRKHGIPLKIGGDHAHRD